MAYFEINGLVVKHKSYEGIKTVLDIDHLEIPEEPHVLTDAEIRADIERKPMTVVCGTIGNDEHSVGLREIIDIKHGGIEKYGIKNVVLDPVMVSTSGHRLIEESAIEVIKSRLIPLARVITPNIPEAEILSGRTISSEADFPEVAKILSSQGVSVLLKAGHLTGDDLVDYFYNAEDGTTTELPSKRVYTRNTHGTGCTLSSAFAAALARGEELTAAATSAKKYIEGAIISGAKYEIGHGHGPVNHFWK